jgi:hypothetical protein
LVSLGLLLLYNFQKRLLLNLRVWHHLWLLIDWHAVHHHRGVEPGLLELKVVLRELGYLGGSRGVPEGVHLSLNVWPLHDMLEII